MERTPKHSLRLVKAASSSNQPLLDLGDCTMRAVLWSLLPLRNRRVQDVGRWASQSPERRRLPSEGGALRCRKPLALAARGPIR